MKNSTTIHLQGTPLSVSRADVAELLPQLLKAQADLDAPEQVTCLDRVRRRNGKGGRGVNPSTIRRHTMNRRQRIILDALGTGPQSSSTLARLCGDCPEASIRRDIQAIRAAGYPVSDAESPDYLYRLPLTLRHQTADTGQDDPVDTFSSSIG